MQQPEAEEGSSENNYLVFTINEVEYGAPLLSVKEVVKVNGIKGVPFMRPHFLGVMNLRGAIVSVIDLRIRFAAKNVDKNKKGLILIVEGENRLIGMVVDEVKSVIKIDKDSIEIPHEMPTTVPTDFIIGMGKKDDMVINIMDLSKIVNQEELREIKAVA